ncbi:MAG: hypothetical protein NTY75_02715 [Candidatus Shapirobacteria bacterium]|nr:hypothetical protein [Candidatus Shapirobacteria bacterium]
MSPAKPINFKIIPILILIVLSLFFRLYQLKDRYIFDWDQADDATKISEIVQTLKPRLIGPRVANETGFFVGPFHYYFQIPFYLAANGNPYFGAYAAIFVATVTTIFMYLILSLLFTSNIAFLSALIFAVNYSVTSWNVMYTPLLSLIIFYICYRIIQGNKTLLPWLFFTYSFASTTHLVPASLILPIILTLILSRYQPSFKQIILSVGLFLLPFLPLIIFDLKHQFINLTALIHFIFSTKTSTENVPFLFLRSYWRSLNLFFLTNSILITITRITIIFVSLYEIIRNSDKKIRHFELCWVLTPLFILMFYHGNIPEYYYGASAIIYPILIARFISKINFKPIYPAFIIILLVCQSQYFSIKPSSITLANKLNLATYLVHQTTDKVFNLSYDLPNGLNTGFAYVFKYLGKEPQNIPQGHLYSVFLTSNPPKTGQIVYFNNTIGLVRK